MSNMSYCRCQNTLEDLRDCAENLHEEMSEEEHAARLRMIELCERIVKSWNE